MKLFLLGMLLLFAVPTFTNVNYSPMQEILGVSFVEEAYAETATLTLDEVITQAPVVSEVKTEITEEEVKPYFDVVNSALALLNKHFPNVGPAIQAFTEIIGGLASFFTLLVGFLLAVIKIPAVVARFSGAHEFAEKIEKIGEKVIYYAKLASIFNAQKKRI